MREEQMEPLEAKTSVSLMYRAGLIRQSTAGVFTYLPMGRRILDKISAIVDEEMQSIGAAKLSMPTLLKADLWKKTGRWSDVAKELFVLKDRKGSDFLLGPTFEEEVTSLIAKEIHSYRHLPLYVYQIGHKFRDEARPRFGLLRAREFIMKDLYTFDPTPEEALKTYQKVALAYSTIFDRLGLPFCVAEADSGQIGGSISHEYLYPSPVGQDTILNCKQCHYTASDEKAVSRFSRDYDLPSFADEVQIESIDHHGQSLPVILSRDRKINHGKASSFLKSSQGKILVDESASSIDHDELAVVLQTRFPHLSQRDFVMGDFRKAIAGDTCPNCNHPLGSFTAIEVGHTFYLGTKYSKPLNAMIQPKDGKTRIPLEMGCFGIGISRIMGAIADLSMDEKGLCWPAAIAPFQVCLVFATQKQEVELLSTIEPVLKSLRFDIVVEDRYHLGFGARLGDAELQGYPLVLIFGKRFEATGQIEIHHRKSGETVSSTIKSLAMDCQSKL